MVANPGQYVYRFWEGWVQNQGQIPAQKWVGW